MNEFVVKDKTADEELIDVLTSISVVSMRLARDLTMLTNQRRKKGERKYGSRHFERTR